MKINPMGSYSLNRKQLNNNRQCENKDKQDYARSFDNACSLYPVGYASYPIITFTGYRPSQKNLTKINQIIDLIKSEGSKKIALLAHANPDEDADGSMIAFALMIEEATGKKVDVFLKNPLRAAYKFLDPDNKINNIVKTETPSNGQSMYLSESEIKEKFGIYDLAIGLDTSKEDLFDKCLKNAILMPAKNKVKVDHHLVQSSSADNKTFNYDITLVDDSLESASQIVMQFAEPLGLDIKNINPLISDALSLGVIGDSEQFIHIRSKQLFEDVAELSESSDMEKIIKQVSKLTPAEHKMVIDILANKVKYSNNDKIAYFKISKSEYPSLSKFVIEKIFNELKNIDGIEYSFAIVEDFASKGFTTSIRSNSKSIESLLEKFGGGGHARAGAIAKPQISSDEMVSSLINELTEL